MSSLNPHSLQSIYFSVNYIIALEWPSHAAKRLDFQKRLAEYKVDFDQSRVGQRDFVLVRTEPSHFMVKIASLGPRVSNISISSERPEHTLDNFTRESEAVCNAYQEVFLSQPCQILQCGVNIRHLYSCQEHAFKYLWETRLNQDPVDFAFLGKKPVLGGGLRLVIPPVMGETEPVQIEVKIESFFQESNKMFVETAFVWPQPRLLPIEKKFDSTIRLQRVEKYAKREVWEFLTKQETKRQQ